MVNRRDLMKLFGAGAVIVPVIEPEVTARIIEPPKVELIRQPVLAMPLELSEVTAMAITLICAEGTHRTIECAVPWRSYGNIGPFDQIEILIHRSNGFSPRTTRAVLEAGGRLL